jgi:hypothetical protein
MPGMLGETPPPIGVVLGIGPRFHIAAASLSARSFSISRWKLAS